MAIDTTNATTAKIDELAEELNEVLKAAYKRGDMETVEKCGAKLEELREALGSYHVCINDLRQYRDDCLEDGRDGDASHYQMRIDHLVRDRHENFDDIEAERRLVESQG